MRLFARKHYAVANLHLALEGPSVGKLHPLLRAATDEIAASDGDFEVAAEAAVRVVEALLACEDEWVMAANWGEVFTKEEDAGAYGDESFADAAGRYLSSGEGGGGGGGSVGDGALVVMMTFGYEGEVPELEKTLATRTDVAAALTAVKGLYHRGRLQLVHLHHAPGSPDEVLTETQLEVSYPELLQL